MMNWNSFTPPYRLWCRWLAATLGALWLGFLVQAALSQTGDLPNGDSAPKDKVVKLERLPKAAPQRSVKKAIAIWEDGNQYRLQVYRDQLVIDCRLTLAPDGAISVHLSNLAPADGVPDFEPVDPTSETDEAAGKPAPTPMEYRWRHCTIQPFLKNIVVQQNELATATQVQFDVYVKASGTARKLQTIPLDDPVHPGDFGFETPSLPYYGPDVKIDDQEIPLNLGSVVIGSIKDNLPALNKIPKNKFREGELTKVSYSSRAENVSSESRAEEVQIGFFSNRTFLMSKQGMVRVKKAGADWVRVQENMDLSVGDMVKTLSNGKAEVALAGTGVIRVKPNSDFIIPENGANTKEKISFLQMIKGVLWAKARKDNDELKVATPNAIIGVRGTEFVINLGEDERGEPATCAYCYEGKVAVWKRTERDEAGDLLAELSPNDSVCVGPRGVTKPDSTGDGELPRELTVELSNKDRTPTVRVAPGAAIKVKVATYGGTGYQMNMVPLDRSGLTQTGGPVDESMKRPGGKVVVGAGTWKVYDFKVSEKARGKFPVTFQFSRGGGKVEVEYTLMVQVGE